MTETTYILVHGAWSGGWCWRDVGAELTRRDANWTALDLPSSTHGAHPNTFLADDAHEVIEIAKLDGPVVLVGHSYGGAVITEAADQVPNLERLIYVAAFVPALGQSVSEANQEAPNRTLLDQAVDPGLQELMAQRCTEVARIDSGHSPFLSQPVALCDLLLTSV